MSAPDVPFLLNAWQCIAYSSEVEERPLPRQAAEIPILLYRLSSGNPVALEDLCPHRFVPLSAGKRVADEIECGYHGLRFAADGTCTLIPGQPVIPDRCRVRSFPVAERYGLVWIWAGDPELADAALLPNLDWLEDSEWSTVTGYLHFECNHHLVTDNLLDLSHETYVHPSSIGNDEEDSIATFEPQVFFEGQTIGVERQMLNIATPPFIVPFVNGANHIDRRQTAFFAPPGINLSESEFSVAGSSEGAGMTRTLHLLTPETNKSTHYFWFLSIHSDRRDAVPKDVLRRAVPEIFGQDSELLALQQISVDRIGPPAVPGVALKVDDAPLRALRLYRSLLRQESQSGRVVVNRWVREDGSLERKLIQSAGS